MIVHLEEASWRLLCFIQIISCMKINNQLAKLYIDCYVYSKPIYIPAHQHVHYSYNTVATVISGAVWPQYVANGGEHYKEWIEAIYSQIVTSTT